MHREIAAARLRRRDEANRDVVHAWHVVAIYVQTRAKKKLPDLKTLLSTDAPRTGSQSIGQQRSMLALLSAQYGYPVKWGKAQTA